MSVIFYEIGDMVYVVEDILNDGGMFGVDEEEGLIVLVGLCGVVVYFGVVEMDESKEIYFVCFEIGFDGLFGNLVGCLLEELIQEELVSV